MLKYLAWLWALILVFLLIMQMPVPPWFLPPETPIVDPAWPVIVWPHSQEPAPRAPGQPAAEPWSPELRPTIAVPSGLLASAAGAGAQGAGLATSDRVTNPSGLPRSVSAGNRSSFHSGSAKPAGASSSEAAPASVGGHASPAALAVAAVGLCGGGAGLAWYWVRRRQL